ncbi:MAG: hypothetical protein A2Y41_04785 [Spirochaetes bacterium GWB1_36_13]|nr:MAG: hypothetical protein A2Y41_04785 [Spirochaetes bacterium GWB1_36_13]
MKKNKNDLNIEKNQWRRWLRIDELIRNWNYPSAKVIAEEYEVCKRTIERDIEFLKTELSAPIEYDKAKKGYYYSDKNYRLSFVSMKEKEFFALMIAEKALEQYKNTPFYNRLSEMFERINLMLSSNISVKTTWISDRFTFLEMPNTVIQEEIWDAVVEAIDTSKEISIIYQKVRGEPGGRVIQPYHIINNAGQLYLVAYCLKSKDLRVFVLSRVLEVKKTDQSFQIPDDFEIHNFIEKRFGNQPSNEEWNIRIRFDKAIAQLISERIWFENQCLKKEKAESVVLEFKTRSLLEIERWVLSWGQYAEVLEPQILKDKVVEELKNAVRHYEKEI